MREEGEGMEGKEAGEDGAGTGAAGEEGAEGGCRRAREEDFGSDEGGRKKGRGSAAFSRMQIGVSDYFAAFAM